MGKRKPQRGRPKGSAGARERKDADSAPGAADRGSHALVVPGALFGRRFWLAPFAAFAALLALYVWSLAPSVVGGDSGELMSAALTGGVPHPPGYPLFSMLARLFAALPLGHTPAWHVNLLSAVATAAAGGLVCATVALWTTNAAAGLAAAALFGTSSEVWLHACSAEVFGLNACFVALALLLWLCVERTHARRYVFGLALASGLAMCNHHTYVFVGGPLMLRALWVTRRSLGARGVALALVAGLVGLLPYAYLPHASASSAAISWGDETTLNGFLDHVLRRNYGTFSMGKVSKGGAFVAEGTFFPTLWRMVGYAFPRLLWLGPVLSVIGFMSNVKDRDRRGPAYTLLFVLGFYVLAYCMLSNLSTSRELYVTVLARFFIQSDLLLAVAAGLGFATVWRWAEARRPTLVRRRWLAPGVAIVLLLAGVAAHGREASQRGNRVFSDFVTTALTSVPPNAIVISMGDHLTGSLFYFHEVEALRPDVIHLDRELLGFSWYCKRKRRLHPELFLPEGGYGKNGWKIKQLLDGNPTRPVVVIDRLETWDQSWKDGYKLASNGLVHPIVRAADFPDFAQWLARDKKALGSYDVTPALVAREGSWESALGQMVLTTESGRAHLALLYSTSRGNDPAPARTAVALLEDIVAKAGGDAQLGIRPWPGVLKISIGPSVWKDLGIGYEVLSRVDASYLPKVALAYEKFVERAEPDDTDLPAARKYVETHSLKRPR
jgi:hypothetical protein